MAVLSTFVKINFSCKDVFFTVQNGGLSTFNMAALSTCRESSHYPDPIPETALEENLLAENALTDIAYQSRYWSFV
jgi:hypothetical protein